jgi:hypothetical protein
MSTILRWLSQHPNVGLALFLFDSTVCLLLPWAVVRLRDRRRPSTKPVRRIKSSVWAALIAAAVAFPFICVLLGMIAWSAAAGVPKPGGRFPGDLTDEQVFNTAVGVVVPLTCLLSALIYRLVRWERIEVADAGQPDAGQASQVQGPASGATTRCP